MHSMQWWYKLYTWLYDTDTRQGWPKSQSHRSSSTDYDKQRNSLQMSANLCHQYSISHQYTASTLRASPNTFIATPHKHLSLFRREKWRLQQSYVYRFCTNPTTINCLTETTGLPAQNWSSLDGCIGCLSVSFQAREQEGSGEAQGNSCSVSISDSQIDIAMRMKTQSGNMR